MTQHPKTLEEHIDCLARLTGATDSFVSQVRTLFTSKGISLDTDAGPFLPALEEAFRREEGIRSSSFSARQNIERIQENFQRVGKAYVEQISQLKKLQKNLQRRTRKILRGSQSTESGNPTHVTIKGDHRTLVTRFERETLPMVPGPKETQ